MPSSTDFQRLELKLDEVVKSVNKLIIIEERQSNQAADIKELWAALELTKVMLGKDLKANELASQNNKELIDRWVQRGLGAWFILGTIFIIIEFIVPLLIHKPS